MSICVYLSHFAVQQRLAQHCKSAILQLKKNKLKKENIHAHKNMYFNIHSSINI